MQAPETRADGRDEMTGASARGTIDTLTVLSHRKVDHAPRTVAAVAGCTYIVALPGAGVGPVYVRCTQRPSQSGAACSSAGRSQVTVGACVS